MKISRRSRRNILGGSVSFLAAIGAGLALAAVLSTDITGFGTIKTAPAAEPQPVSSRVLSASGSLGDALDCRQVGVSGDSATLTFKPVLTRPAGGQQGNESCTVTLRVRNTGDTTLNVAPSSGFNAPAGWSVGAISGDAVTSPIAPGQLKEARVTVTATPGAQEGAFSGRLAYNDGN